MQAEHFDIIIIGAGLSGVGAGVHLQQRLPHKSYAILEGRDALGGTWDLFRYPGVRSDSDMFTLGYAFKPWTEAKAIADGPAILNYIQATAREHGVNQHIRLRHRLTRAAWSSRDALWTLDVEHAGQVKRFTCAFLILCAGYYDVDQAYLPAFPGAERFQGALIQPQHWPENLDYAGKRVIVIGSGATAVTLVPALAGQAAHVTMLQRSPTYYISLPAIDPFANFIRRLLPESWAYNINRFLRASLQQIFFHGARAWPRQTRKNLLKRVAAQLGAAAVRQHFSPRYNPWEQRLCLVPDNDLFAALRSSKAAVVTDEIAAFTETGVKLRSGQMLEADIVVAATGLKVRLLGGAAFSVDGRAIASGALYTYKGAMFSGLPNLASIFGYTNASWTLKADLISEYVCRLIRYMDAHNYAAATPRLNRPHQDKPFIDFSSGYIQRAADILPKQTDTPPWKLSQSYLHDLIALRHGRIDDGALEFTRRPVRQREDAAAPRVSEFKPS